jgi:HEAT repeat protein
LLADPSLLCRFTAQDSLLRIGSPVIGPLTEYLMQVSTTHEKEGGLAVAAGLASPSFLPAAVRLANDSSPQVRGRAATILGALGGTEATAVLIALLSDPAINVRAAAAHALGSLTHWQAATSLGELLRDASWEVRREAGLALRALGAPGRMLLRRLLRDRDPFAADMARQILDLPELTLTMLSP